MKTLLAAMVILSVSSVMAGESKRPEAQAVDSSCTQEAQVAGCGAEKVGTGLLKCMHAYRQQHKDFKISEGCQTALKTLREDHKERKEAAKK